MTKKNHQIDHHIHRDEDWIDYRWRPLMAYLYMIICAADFFIFPILWTLYQGTTHAPLTQWLPLTLQGAGLFHLAFGAIIGVSSYGRTQEKVSNNNTLQNLQSMSPPITLTSERKSTTTTTTATTSDSDPEK